VRACGVERWPVKIALDRDAARVDTTPVTATIAQLGALPRPRETAYSARSGPYELRSYRVIGVLRRVRRETDGDWHLVLSDTGDARITMIAEVPDSNCAIGARYAEAFARLGRRLDSLRVPAVVEVTGIGFFDRPHGQRGAAPNWFELHPVLALRIMDARPDTNPRRDR
jgi:hypothetical protein